MNLFSLESNGYQWFITKIFIFLLFSLLQLVKIRSQSSAFFAGATRRGGHEMKPWTVGPGASRGPEGKPSDVEVNRSPTGKRRECGCKWNHNVTQP